MKPKRRRVMKPVTVATEKYAKKTGERTALVYQHSDRFHTVIHYAPEGKKMYNLSVVENARAVWKDLRKDLVAKGFAKVTK